MPRHAHRLAARVAPGSADLLERGCRNDRRRRPRAADPMLELGHRGGRTGLELLVEHVLGDRRAVLATEAELAGLELLIENARDRYRGRGR